MKIMKCRNLLPLFVGLLALGCAAPVDNQEEAENEGEVSEAIVTSDLLGHTFKLIENSTGPFAFLSFPKSGKAVVNTVDGYGTDSARFDFCFNALATGPVAEACLRSDNRVTYTANGNKLCLSGWNAKPGTTCFVTTKVAGGKRLRIRISDGTTRAQVLNRVD